MDELKNCPFCGGPATIFDRDNQLAWNGNWIIQCDDCVAEMRSCYIFDPTKKNGNKKKVARRKEVIRDWNRRV